MEVVSEETRWRVRRRPYGVGWARQYSQMGVIMISGTRAHYSRFSSFRNRLSPLIEFAEIYAR